MATKVREQRENAPRKPRRAPKDAQPPVTAAPNEEATEYERRIAERSPDASQEARHFLAQLRVTPAYRAVMRDLADK